MTRRDLLSAFGISFAAWRTAAGDAAGQGKDEKKPTRATVTLAIDGMT